MQGVCNTGSNVGGYFLSTMIIGGFLDWGGPPPRALGSFRNHETFSATIDSP